MRGWAAGAVASLTLAGAAAASPTGTPQANAPRDGKGTSIELPFGRRHAASVAAKDGAPDVPGRRLSQAEWRRAFIARHGHDIQPAVHPGH